MPAYPGFGGATYQSRSLTVDCERCQNLYPEVIESQQGSSKGQRFALYGTPGKRLAGALAGGAGAALVPADNFGFPDNTSIIWYAIAGNKLYAVTFAFVAGAPAITGTLIGTVDSAPLLNGQLRPAQILVLGDKWLFVVANGKAFVAGYGKPISASTLAVGSPISLSTLNAGGAGYAVGDTGTINGGTVSAQYTVLTVSGGAVVTYQLTDPGSGYAIAAAVATTDGGVQPGVGAGFAINITATSGGMGYAVGDTGVVLQSGVKVAALYTVNTVDGSGAVLTYTIAPTGAGYLAGTNLATAVGGAQPGTGAGFTIDVTAVGAPAWAIARQTIAGILPGDYYVNFATWMDGYVIVSLAPNTTDDKRTRFYISGLFDPNTWSTLAFGDKEANPDPVVAPYAAYENLLLLGTQTMEIWWDSGNLLFPFTRVQGGGVIEAGCASPFTIQKMDGTVMWLGQDARGTNVVWQLRGLTPVRVSNHAIETRWKDFNGSLAMAYCYQEAGHYFYVLTFPIEDQTWVLDSATQQWHERTSFDGAASHADYGRYGAYGNEIGHGALDYRNGNFYMCDIGYWDEAGSVINRERVPPPLLDEESFAFYARCRLLTQQGNPPASDAFLGPVPTEVPAYTLEISRDAGQTWETPQPATGSATDTLALIEWWALGAARQFAVRIRSSSRINHAWANLFLELKKGVTF